MGMGVRWGLWVTRLWEYYLLCKTVSVCMYKRVWEYNSVPIFKL
jgi:hypothetical protein